MMALALYREGKSEGGVDSRTATGRAMEVTSTESPITAGALFELQVAQFEHDEVYHREISRLTVQGRLNHYTLHFAKYVGRIARMRAEGNSETVQQTIVDSFVITLCAANTLNLHLSSALSQIHGVAEHDLADLARRLAERSEPAHFELGDFLEDFAVATGRLAKACESLDHLEDFPFRRESEEAIIELCQLILVSAHRLRIDLSADVPSRLAGVKEKLFLHGWI